MEPPEMRKRVAAFVDVVPVANRRGRLIVPSTHTTGSELKSVKAALEHRPAKADGFAAIGAILLAVIVAYKTTLAATGQIGGMDLVFLLIAFATAVVAVQKYRTAKDAKDPLNETAIEHVNGWIANLGPSPEDAKAASAGDGGEQVAEPATESDAYNTEEQEADEELKS